MATEVIVSGHTKRPCVELGPNWALNFTTGNWTMEKCGKKLVLIAHADDKRQITAVLAANATGEYLPPQLIYKGKTTRFHTENRWSNEEIHSEHCGFIYFKTEKRSRFSRYTSSVGTI